MKRVVLPFAVLALLALVGCKPILIDDPLDGSFRPAGTMTVTGSIPSNLPPGGTLTVNGIPTTVEADGSWSQAIPTSPVGTVTVVDAIYTQPDGKQQRQRTAVVVGDKLTTGEFSPDGVGMNFTNAGIHNLGPVINDLAGGSFDISGLIMAQDPLIPPTDAGSGVTITGKAYEAGSSGVGIDASSTASGVKTDITVTDLYIGLDLQLSGFISGPCKLELQVPTTTIGTTFDFAPNADQVDVNLVGAPTIDIQDLSYEFISGQCDPSTPIVGSIINSQAGGAIEGAVRNGFGSQLGDPDGSGPADSPIAEAIETALAQVSIAGPVGDAVQAHLDAPFTRIDETGTGIDFRADADFRATKGTDPGDCAAPPGAPALPDTYDLPSAYPTLGGTTPGGEPYGLGLVISSSAFNQLLGAMTECGLLNHDITEISLGGGAPAPVTSTLLSALVPQFATKLPAGTPMLIRTDPTYGPFLTHRAGPNGETAELMLVDLRISFIEPKAGGDVTWMELAVDAPLGFEMAYDAGAGELAPTITPPAAGAVTARLVDNRVRADQASVEAIFPNLFPLFVGGLSDSFAAFPLPSFLGLDLDVLEVARQDNSYVLYADLTPTPRTRLEGVSVTDLSTPDFSHDDLTFDSWEWRHRLRKQISSNQVKVNLDGLIGADACCTVDDELATAHAGYRVAFTVVPEDGDTWKVDMSHFIRGAHTANSEGVGGGFGAQTNISRITGRYRVGTGAWQEFSFDVGNDFDYGANPNETTPWQGGWCGCAFHEPFKGSSAAAIQGDTTQSVVVEFYFDVTAWSDSNTWFPAEAGNEAAIRFGANDSLTNNFSVGDYPGPGNRKITDDGHFGTITLTTVP